MADNTSSVSRVSRHSRVSNRSVISVKAAQLETKLRYLEAESEIDIQKRQLKWKEEQLKLAKELDIEKARSQSDRSHNGSAASLASQKYLDELPKEKLIVQKYIVQQAQTSNKSLRLKIFRP